MFGLHSSILLPFIVTKQGWTHVRTFKGENMRRVGKVTLLDAEQGVFFFQLCKGVNARPIPWRFIGQGIPIISGTDGEKHTEGALFVYRFLRERMLTCLDKYPKHKNNPIWRIQAGNIQSVPQRTNAPCFDLGYMKEVFKQLLAT